MAEYNSDSISVLKGLDAVQKRPGMYTDTEKPNHLAQEVLDNSVDEALSGHADHIIVKLSEDGFVDISDNGRGIPTDIHPEEGIPGAQVILETLHSGGKFENNNYAFSGGLHGVGISVVNALSSVVEVTIKREGKTHLLSYANAVLDKPLTVVKGGKVNKSDTGTRIRFKPDPQYFDTEKIDVPALEKLLLIKSILCPGLRIEFYVEKKGEFAHKEFFYDSGLQAFIEERDDAKDNIGDIIFVGEGKKDEPPMEITWGAFFTSIRGKLQDSYTNLIPTISGGTHVNAFRQGLLDGIREFGEMQNLIPKNITLKTDDIWRNTNYVLSLKMQDPQFASQTKERLSSRNCASFITGQVKDNFSLYLNKHSEQGTLLLEQVLKNASSRIREAKKVVRKEIGKSMRLPGKLADCDTKNRDEAEVFLVEGDSAGGSAKQARNRDNQAILPLRGKILNTWEVDSDTILSSKEIDDISTAIGVDPASSDLSELRYNKICILADADSDGLHIAVLVIALMVKHFPAIVENGHLYVAMPPLYRIDVGKSVFYALDDSEKSDTLEMIENKKLRGKVSVQRFKGLGEMNPPQLRETTLDPVTRRLVRLTSCDPEHVNKVFDMLLMKKNASARQEWLSEHGDAFELEL